MRDDTSFLLYEPHPAAARPAMRLSQVGVEVNETQTLTSLGRAGISQTERHGVIGARLRMDTCPPPPTDTAVRAAPYDAAYWEARYVKVSRGELSAVWRSESTRLNSSHY